ncbi:hypothetical protein CJ030_MR7G016731 [Morella rubra]|uniref:Uncharacterized protein n=1 Tax=Morella rubra TaxID=262757 RepID=A0A6A1UZL5_9ROSI|nr:hypothetical protein CJ030_MR7G016731 [Morella rubra]
MAMCPKEKEKESLGPLVLVSVLAFDLLEMLKEEEMLSAIKEKQSKKNSSRAAIAARVALSMAQIYRKYELVSAIMGISHPAHVMTDVAGHPLDFSKGRYLDLDARTMATCQKLMCRVFGTSKSLLPSSSQE